MQNVTNPTVKTHVVWLDVVRLIAMFTVVCCHCTDPFNFYPGDSPIIGDIKFWGAAYGAFLRPCVPLFVMISTGSYNNSRKNYYKNPTST